MAAHPRDQSSVERVHTAVQEKPGKMATTEPEPVEDVLAALPAESATFTSPVQLDQQGGQKFVSASDYSAAAPKPRVTVPEASVVDVFPARTSLRRLVNLAVSGGGPEGTGTTAAQFYSSLVGSLIDDAAVLGITHELGDVRLEEAGDIVAVEGSQLLTAQVIDGPFQARLQCGVWRAQGVRLAIRADAPSRQQGRRRLRQAISCLVAAPVIKLTTADKCALAQLHTALGCSMAASNERGAATEAETAVSYAYAVSKPTKGTLSVAGE